MYKPPVTVERLSERLDPQPDRVIARLFAPGDEMRIKGIIERIRGLSDADCSAQLQNVSDSFARKHPDLTGITHSNFERIEHYVSEPGRLTEKQKALLGAYFTMEYAIEAAALFNPSMVPAIDQQGVPEGSVRFLMSLRAVGEGHISSIVFRGGTINRDGHIAVDPASRYSRQLEVVEDRVYRKHRYEQKLVELGEMNEAAAGILAQLGEPFTFSELNDAIEQAREAVGEHVLLHETAEHMLGLARANYALHLPQDANPSELVIFPNSDNESQGIEDVRLVRFEHPDGRVCYYGVYTAYNGSQIVPQLLEASTFDSLKVHTLGGRHVQNKGMALFPRQVGSDYLMLGRLDNENIFLMRSDDVLFWNHEQTLLSPKYPWELIQIGNCGSPLETEAGWIVLTHGVGPMRQYCIGAALLDLDDPARVIGRLAAPLLAPSGDERVGYVPNVVYSCGGMIHNDNLIIPYGISDQSATFARVSVPELLDVLTRSPAKSGGRS